MNVILKLTPTFSNYFSADKQFLRAPIMCSYEDKTGTFSYSVTDGLSLVGKKHIETSVMSYYIGVTCSFEQLDTFINKFIKNEFCSIIFNDGDHASASVNTVSYDPSINTWTHKSDSIEHHCGGVITLKLNDESLEQFKEALMTYRNFVYMLIEGHKMLQDKI